jgi:hypothetical protein
MTLYPIRIGKSRVKILGRCCATCTFAKANQELIVHMQLILRMISFLSIRRMKYGDHDQNMPGFAAFYGRQGPDRGAGRNRGRVPEQPHAEISRIKGFRL